MNNKDDTQPNHNSFFDSLNFSQAPLELLSGFGGLSDLSNDERQKLRNEFIAMFQEYSYNIDPEQVFDCIAKGSPPYKALNLPFAVCDFLYSNAYQWLSISCIEKAEPLFRALCTMAGTDAKVDYWVGYGICFKLRKEWQMAENCLQIALSIRPEWAIPYFHLLDIYINQGHYLQGQAALEAFAMYSEYDKDIPWSVRKEVERLTYALEAQSPDYDPDELGQALTSAQEDEQNPEK